MSIEVETTIRFESIRVPNYIIIDDGVIGRRQDGFLEKPKKRVEDLTYNEAHALAEQWRKDFLTKAGHAGAL